MPALVPRYTATEVRRFPDDRVRYEVIRGEPFVTLAPGTVHQRAVLELARRLQDYLETHGLGEALPAPFEVEFTEDSAVQPDVLVILEPQRRHLTPRRLHRPPALVVEIVSYTSKRTDRLEKRELYQAEGVPEYWVVDIEPLRLDLPTCFAKLTRKPPVEPHIPQGGMLLPVRCERLSHSSGPRGVTLTTRRLRGSPLRHRITRWSRSRTTPWSPP